ncbi:MAG: hypothetical protein WC668_01540 [Patescibacteria group bacterium]
MLTNSSRRNSELSLFVFFVRPSSILVVAVMVKELVIILMNAQFAEVVALGDD